MNIKPGNLDLEKIEGEIKKFKLNEDYTVSDNETGTITYTIKSEKAKKELRLKVFGSEKDEIDVVIARGKGNCGSFGKPYYHYQEAEEGPDYFTIEGGEDKRKKDAEWKENNEKEKQEDVKWKREREKWLKELDSPDNKKVREYCFSCGKEIRKADLPKDMPTITRIKITEKGQELAFCSLECCNDYKKKETNELENKQKLNKFSPLLIFGFLSIAIFPVIYLLVKKKKK
ncbi:hypothetical protein [endosymbiont GvMRE of Glomus versiforme]|uniref:hypothetical protein n=1 Tax=endosymbiont GvMRE of Glomus versiforme TaxID=2039283 RepID=UPI000EDB7E84|nr:hypothetical protein [endosymbiont GvMRE of Glomus versiforme]RHZ37058.1 hypothetical protein GvMRE_I2g141 [endosymbiont GvMRE of Glomus versiforme]